MTCLDLQLTRSLLKSLSSFHLKLQEKLQRWLSWTPSDMNFAHRCGKLGKKALLKSSQWSPRFPSRGQNFSLSHMRSWGHEETWGLCHSWRCAGPSCQVHVPNTAPSSSLTWLWLFRTSVPSAHSFPGQVTVWDHTRVGFHAEILVCKLFKESKSKIRMLLKTRW